MKLTCRNFPASGTLDHYSLPTGESGYQLAVVIPLYFDPDDPLDDLVVVEATPRERAQLRAAGFGKLKGLAAMVPPGEEES